MDLINPAASVDMTLATDVDAGRAGVGSSQKVS